MRVVHCGGTIHCNSLEDLQAVLLHRSENNANDFELYGNNDYPYLTILVHDPWACVHFFASAVDCGRYAYSVEKQLNEDEYTSFWIGSSTEVTEISNHLVIPFSSALVIAQDFFRRLNRSEIVNWFEL